MAQTSSGIIVGCQEPPAGICSGVPAAPQAQSAGPGFGIGALSSRAWAGLVWGQGDRQTDMGTGGQTDMGIEVIDRHGDRGDRYGDRSHRCGDRRDRQTWGQG